MRYFLGVDLAGVESRPSGICLLTEELTCLTWTLFSDREILETTSYFRPRAVALDAPLARPLRGWLRRCERELRAEGVKVLPSGLGPMEKLTRRGIRLSRRLRQLGYTTLETFPRGVQALLGITSGRRGLGEGLKRLGLVGISETASIHELDAATCALISYLWWIGQARQYGGGREGVITMPLPAAQILPRGSR